MSFSPGVWRPLHLLPGPLGGLVEYVPQQDRRPPPGGHPRDAAEADVLEGGGGGVVVGGGGGEAPPAGGEEGLEVGRLGVVHHVQEAGGDVSGKLGNLWGCTIFFGGGDKIFLENCLCFVGAKGDFGTF